jgi:hypothetical protein
MVEKMEEILKRMGYKGGQEKGFGETMYEEMGTGWGKMEGQADSKSGIEDIIQYAERTTGNLNLEQGHLPTYLLIADMTESKAPEVSRLYNGFAALQLSLGLAYLKYMRKGFEEGNPALEEMDTVIGYLTNERNSRAAKAGMVPGVKKEDGTRIDHKETKEA